MGACSESTSISLVLLCHSLTRSLIYIDNPGVARSISLLEPMTRGISDKEQRHSNETRMLFQIACFRRHLPPCGKKNQPRAQFHTGYLPYRDVAGETSMNKKKTYTNLPHGEDLS